MIDAGVNSFSLTSSPSSEDGHVRVCPWTTVTLTCTASNIGSLAWGDQNGLIHGFLPHNTELEIEHAPYTLTLVAVENADEIDSLANLTSTLEVTVDNINNGTNISCIIFRKQAHLVIYIASKTFPFKIILLIMYSLTSGTPYPPRNMMVQVFESNTKSFSIIISWDEEEESGEVVDEYRILTNTTDHFISTNTTTVVLEGEYNIPLQITLSAINCAGSSAEVTEQLIVGMCVTIFSVMMMMKR